MLAATVLVTMTSAAMGLLSTTLLRGYLFGRADAQLLSFASARPNR